MSVQAATHDPLALLISGGVITTLLTLFVNWLIKKRQHKVDMSKLKIQTMTKVAPLYNRLALHNSWNLSDELRKPRQDRDPVRMMYYLCNIMNIHRQIVRKIGDILLENLDAEHIISNIYRDITTSVERNFGYIDSSRLLHMVDDDMPYHVFHERVSAGSENDLYQKFVHWIYKDETSEEIARNCTWFAQLIMYELNYVYKIWYDEPPDRFRLNRNLQEYLATNHQRYYHRIIKIETGGYIR